MKNLLETIRDKNKEIESLKCLMKKEEINKRPTNTKCRYWNREYCKKENKCQFLHSERDRQKYIETDQCEDRRCEKRHQRVCRYYKTKQDCYRKENCQYLHKDEAQEKNPKKQEYEVFQDDEVRNFDCELCCFTSTRKLTMNKHMNTKRGDNNFIETLSNFIFRLELEEYAEEYKDHFKRYGFTRGEND